MMRKNVLFVILMTVGFVGEICAQELTVKSMTEAGNDISASQYRVNDKNGDPCALVKVQLAVRGAKFAGSVIGTPEFKSGVYWVYMPAGVKELEVQHESFVPCHVNFGNYGIRSLQGLTTYVLTLLMPQANGIVETQKLTINYSPTDAMVLVDSKPYPGNGHLELTLPVGNHNYIIAANGYETVEGAVKLSTNVPRTITEHLVSMTRSSALEVQKTAIYQNSSSYRENMEEVENRIAARVENITVESNTTEEGEAYIKCTYDTSILFATGASRLMSSGVNTLKQICDVLGEYKDKFDVTIDGYTDNIGRHEYNLDLSEKRAKAVAAAISECNSAIRISHVEGHGEVNPVADNSTAAGRAKNRRVEITLHPSEAMLEATRNGTLNNSSTSTIKAAQIPTQTQTPASPTSGNQIETFTVKGVSFNMVRVDGGTFQMGSNSDWFYVEKPIHQVTLSTYYIGETEVTQALWKAVMGTTIRQQRDKADTSLSLRGEWFLRGEDSNNPMYYISWNECQEFVQKLSQLTGKNFRLPTEAEWEYAARGGNKSRGYECSGSNNVQDVAWFYENSGDKPLSGDNETDKMEKNNCRTHIVKTKQPNELGIYDMSGNVWEWCQDWDGEYPSSAQTNPTGSYTGSDRVARGGCWNDYAFSCRVAYRGASAPDYRDDTFGLRLALQ